MGVWGVWGVSEQSHGGRKVERWEKVKYISIQGGTKAVLFAWKTMQSLINNHTRITSAFHGLTPGTSFAHPVCTRSTETRGCVDGREEPGTDGRERKNNPTKASDRSNPRFLAGGSSRSLGYKKTLWWTCWLTPARPSGLIAEVLAEGELGEATLI